MEKIKDAGRQLQTIVKSLLIFAPVAYTGLFFWQGPTALLQIPETSAIDLSKADTIDMLLLFLFPILTPLVYWLAFLRLYHLVSQYAQGEVFTVRAAQQIRQIGLLLLLTDFVFLVQQGLSGPLLQLLGLADGFLVFELRLGTSIIGLFLLLISRIMLLASELQEQQRLTI